MKIFIALVLILGLSIPARAQSAPAFWNDIQNFKKWDSATPPPANAILFTGSSSFTRWTDVKDYFPGYTIINRGFGGSTLLDVIRYTYDAILPYHPRQVVIYCGENDLASSDTVTAQMVFTRFKTLFGMLRTNLPTAQISFVAIKPSPSRKYIFNRVVEANKLISTYLRQQKNAAFINIFPAMLDAKGQARPELFVEDMLHMKPEGYRIWQRIMKPYLLK